jgi:hypothetical protein
MTASGGHCARDNVHARARVDAMRHEGVRTGSSGAAP